MTAYHTTYHAYATAPNTRDGPIHQYPLYHQQGVSVNNVPYNDHITQSNCQYHSNGAVAYYPMQNHYYACYPHIPQPSRPLIATSTAKLNLLSSPSRTIENGRKCRKADIAPNDILFDRYAVLKRIGEGTFGDIWKVLDTKDPNRKKYAIKTLKMDKTWSESKRDRLRTIFRNEGRRIHSLNNIATEEIGQRFIITCKQYIGPYIVMELAGHSLLSYMEYHVRHRRAIALSTIRVICIQIFSALSFIHGLGQMIHCDLKPENILIGSDNSIKIIDFGNSMSFKKEITSFDIQTLWYRAPEVLFGNFNAISSLIDQWSVGCIVYELFSINNGKHERIFRSRKFEATDVICKIYDELHALPQYVYNEYESHHYGKEIEALRYAKALMFHDEATYIKAKSIRLNKLWFKLMHSKQNVIAEDANDKEEMLYFVDLLSCLLDPNPLTRYTSEDGIRHPFVVFGNLMDRESMQRNHRFIKTSDDIQRQQRINEQREKYHRLLRENMSINVVNVKHPLFPATFTKQHLY